MTVNPRFRVADVFPPDSGSVALLRLLVLARQLHAFLESYLQLAPSDSPASRERFYFTVSATFGAAKEAADAFRDADSNGCFRSINAASSSCSLTPALLSLRAACDRNNGDSLYCRVLKPIRDTAAWHWSRNDLAKALAGIQNEILSMYDGSGRPHDTGIPIVALTVASAMLLDRFGLAAIRSIMDEVISFHGSLIELAHQVYYTRVRDPSAQPSRGPGSGASS
jgi:hypothetical protein